MSFSHVHEQLARKTIALRATVTALDNSLVEGYGFPGINEDSPSLSSVDRLKLKLAAERTKTPGTPDF